MVSLLGFDCIWIDLEHHGTSVETAANMMRAARVGAADVMARPGKGEWMRMSRLLEIGAHGILYPRCDDAEEAEQVVRWCKFAPRGERGYDGGNADNAYAAHAPADYIDQANRQTWIAVQVESPEAAQHARAIAEVEGVDMIFFGPADYSILDSRPGAFTSDQTRRAAEAVCRDALAAGKRFGTLCFGLDHARQMIDCGASLVCFGADIGMLRRGLTELRDSIAELGHNTD